MQEDKVKQVGEEWDKAAMGFYFGADDALIDLSVRDTLAPMLEEDQRDLSNEDLRALFDFAKADTLAGAVAEEIHNAYLASKPKG
jgi:hypothetical protein